MINRNKISIPAVHKARVTRTFHCRPRFRLQHSVDFQFRGSTCRYEFIYIHTSIYAHVTINTDLELLLVRASFFGDGDLSVQPVSLVASTRILWQLIGLLQRKFGHLIYIEHN